MATECAVCGKKYVGSECPLCEYEPDFVLGTASEEEQEEAKKEIREWRHKVLKPVKMALKVYDYRKNKIHINGASIQIDEPETGKIEIDASDMELNQIKWFPENFVNLNRVMPLTYVVTDCGGRPQETKFDFAPCREQEVPLHVGIRVKPELKLEVVVGTGNNDFTCSGEYVLKKIG